MVELSINSIKKHGILKTCKIVMIALTAILLCVLIIQLLLPISVDNEYLNAFVQDNTFDRNVPSENNTQTSVNKQSQFFRVGLFKSAVALQGKPLADKTIERIKSQLKLQCVMTMNDQLVAYINIKGVGLKKCAVGDAVNDMFTVLNIDKTKKCVDISIIDHKVTLYM